jgi:hypothetical protein
MELLLSIEYIAYFFRRVVDRKEASPTPLANRAKHRKTISRFLHVPILIAYRQAADPFEGLTSSSVKGNWDLFRLLGWFSGCLASSECDQFLHKLRCKTRSLKRLSFLILCYCLGAIYDPNLLQQKLKTMNEST